MGSDTASLRERMAEVMQDQFGHAGTRPEHFYMAADAVLAELGLEQVAIRNEAGCLWTRGQASDEGWATAEPLYVIREVNDGE